MAIAHDAQTRFPTTDGPSGTNSVDTTTGDRTFTHNPVGTPAGVVVVICSNATAAPVTGVLYAGVAMTPVTDAQDTSEAGSVWIYTLTDEAIPTDDPATVTLQGCTSAEKWVTCSTVTSATNLTTVNASNFKDTTTAANPTLSVVTTDSTLLYGAVVGGAASPGSYAAGTGYTAQFNNDVGTRSARSERRTSPVAAGTITYNFTYATSDDYAIAAVALAELIIPTSTPVAQLSLASHGEPSERTNHTIKIRARTTSGSTGVIKAALYEGSTNRSGDLTSTALTTSLADYTLPIADASAANITDYSNLEIRFWGYDSGGNALVFEVADVYLELPVASGPPTYYGVTSSVVTFTKAVAATKSTFGVTVSALTFVKAVAGKKTTFGQLVAPFTFTKAVSGIRIAFGQLVAPFTFTKAVAATKKTFGQTATTLTFTKAVSGLRTTFGQTVTALTFTKAVSGVRTTFGQLIAPFTFGKAVAGIRTAFSQIAAPFIFVKDVAARRTTFSQITAPFTFSKSIAGLKTTFGQISLSLINTISTAGDRAVNTLYGVITFPITFTKDVAARRTTFGQIIAPFTFSKAISGFKKTFGQITAPFTFTKSIIGQRKTFGQVVVPLTFTKVVSGTRKTFGVILSPFTFTKDIIGRKTTFGQTATPIIFVKTVVGGRTTFSQLVAPFTFNKSVVGRKSTFAQVDLPVTFLKETFGRKETFGQIDFPIDINFSVVAEVQGVRFGSTSMSLIFGKDVTGRKTTFGETTSLYLLAPSVQGSRTTFGRFDRPFIFSKETSGTRETFGQLAFPINATFVVAGDRLGGNYYGQIDMGLIFGEQTIGQRKTFGRIATPYLFATTSQATKSTFGKLDTSIDFIIDVKTGRVEAFSQLAFEILLGLEAAGFVRPTSIILNLAKDIYLGSTSVDAVYAKSQKVWPPN